MPTGSPESTNPNGCHFARPAIEANRASAVEPTAAHLTLLGVRDERGRSLFAKPESRPPIVRRSGARGRCGLDDSPSRRTGPHAPVFRPHVAAARMHRVEFDSP